MALSISAVVSRTRCIIGFERLLLARAGARCPRDEERRLLALFEARAVERADFAALRTREPAADLRLLRDLRLAAMRSP